MRIYDINRVQVTARRTLSGIGTQKTVLDTTAIRDDIAKSLAEVLSQSSSIFIKSYGRGTLATASFRGTAPSHTQVQWNGMKINSPMLGMVDFSMIPSYFVDEVNLYHGASSVGVTGGGLGGAVTLATRPAENDATGAKFILGIGSYDTYDRFAQISVGRDRVRSSTRVLYSTSDNDFKYTNYRKKRYEYDGDGNISGWSYPVERNRNGQFCDLHLLQELYLDTPASGRFSLAAWYVDSQRGVPVLNVDYGDRNLSRNEQNESTFRGVAGWEKHGRDLRIEARLGYTYTDMQYLYLADIGREELSEMINSQSNAHTAFGSVSGDWFRGEKWLLSANITAHQHFVRSVDEAVVTAGGKPAVIGYDQAQTEVSAFASVRWRPVPRLGVSLNIREEMHGTKLSPVIPAIFAECIVSHRGNVTLKASAARNFRFPTLNDLYFMPGGNPDLEPEEGFTYDAGAEFSITGGRIGLSGSATFYDSYINDWILWLPTPKQGLWTPVNVREVHSYGLELKARFTADLGRGWTLYADGNYTISKAINNGDPTGWADRAIGKQLVYIPEYSGAVTARIGWRAWTLAWKFNYYSERYTTSSNERHNKYDRLTPYYMSDVALERRFDWRVVGLKLKLEVNNLFDEEYESVLSHPMPRRNFGLYIEFIPKFNTKK